MIIQQNKIMKKNYYKNYKIINNLIHLKIIYVVHQIYFQNQNKYIMIVNYHLQL